MHGPTPRYAAGRRSANRSTAPLAGSALGLSAVAAVAAPAAAVTPAVAAIVVAVATAACPGIAEASPARSLRWGPVGGVLALHSGLADFRWDTGSRAYWGIQGVLAGARNRHGGGLRVWRAGTTQGIGIPGDEQPPPDVALTGLDALGELELARAAGFRVRGVASLGVVHMGYSPDRIEIDPSGSAPVAVDLDPITELAAGAGLALERPLGTSFGLGFRAERSFFRLDTSHRAGDEIVNERRTFGHWTFALALTHRALGRGESP